jgi:hypothetical protein
LCSVSQNNAQLTSIDGLRGLKTVFNSVLLQDNRALVSANLPKLQSVNEFRVRSCACCLARKAGTSACCLCRF